MPEHIYNGSEWTFDAIERASKEIEIVANEELCLEYYPYNIEIVTAEQMMDAYASHGMPIFYGHWSFGKHFASVQRAYMRGAMNLAYEMVINCRPCLVYCMEENTMTMQVLVIAHAAIGHGAFFANNYLFKQWTQADAIIDYLSFAKKYISDCEEKYGAAEVEQVLDACHALQLHGVDKYKHPRKLSLAEEEKRQVERALHAEKMVNVLWDAAPARDGKEKEEIFPEEPQENILHFIEKHAPELPVWKREIIRISYKIAQYFYPQRQTQVLNEGFATFVHYYIMNRLSQKGLISSGSHLEFLHSHTGVIAQPDGGKLNPYALGFNIFMDVKRMCENPTNEDRELFPDIVGSPWVDTVKSVAFNYRDESGILQFLSPAVIRKMRLFSVLDDDEDKEFLSVKRIHNADGYKDIRKALAAQFDVSANIPIIDVCRVDKRGDRSMTLRYHPVNGIPLDEKDSARTVEYAQQLWGFPVVLETTP